ncbi:glycosyltransferase [Hyphomicrobium sp.]|uniref:glycosyltransferase n=1 Tax=Hyphomicrobium sp. TaxID=82 RepID=UPI002FE11211
MANRYLFLCPDSRSPSGGIAVIYDAVIALHRACYDVSILHNSPEAGYPHPSKAPSVVYHHACRQVFRKYAGRREKLIEAIRMAWERVRGGPASTLNLLPSDVIVVPEFMAAEAAEAFPTQKLVIFVQGPFLFLESYQKCIARGHDIRKRSRYFIGTCDTCMDQFDLLGIKNCFHLPVSMNPEKFPFQEIKDRLITYMPRRRPAEAEFIAAALRERGRIGDYRLEALEGLPIEAIYEKLQQSRFFISLLRLEGLGFPAAEAMAAGCITVGYTGLGPREYFTPETGVPVTDDDTVALIHALEAAVAEYETHPRRLDSLRRHASAEINRRFSCSVFEAKLFEIWRELDAKI